MNLFVLLLLLIKEYFFILNKQEKDYKIKKIEVVLSRDYKDYEKYFPQRKTKSSEDKENKELIYRWSTRRK